MYMFSLLEVSLCHFKIIIATSKHGAERFFLRCVSEFNLICWYLKNQNRVRAGGGDANDVDDGDTGGGGAVADDDGGDSD